MQFAIERRAQTGEGVEVHVARRARIEAVDEVLRHACLFRQPARGHAFTRRGLIFPQ